MANTRSALKQWRVSLKKRARNRVARGSARTVITKARRLIRTAAASDEAAVTVKDALRALDKGAQKGVVHPNNAARRKSRLMKQLNAAASAS